MVWKRDMEGAARDPKNWRSVTLNEEGKESKEKRGRRQFALCVRVGEKEVVVPLNRLPPCYQVGAAVWAFVLSTFVL